MISLEYLKTNLKFDCSTRNKILRLFISQLSDVLYQMELSYSNSDFQAIEELAHKAKNLFGIVGASEQLEMAKNIEIISAKKDPDNELSVLIPKIINDCEIAIMEVENLCSN